MQCPQCQFDNPAQMKFCGQCGNRLQLVCASCGAELPPGFRFCGQCGVPLRPTSMAPQERTVPDMAPTPVAPGTPLGHGYAPSAPGSHPPSTEPNWAPGASPRPAADPPPQPQFSQFSSPASAMPGTPTTPGTAPTQSEIKQVSVLSAELQARSKQDGALDAERLHALLGRFFELAREEVERFGGNLKPPSGSSLQALFGAPIAHEDHARRAALAALALRRRLNQELASNALFTKVQGRLHIGLDTGQVVVGGLGDVAVGEATEQAQRLRELALANEILASDRMRETLRDAFDFRAAESENGDRRAFRVEERTAEQEVSRWHGGRLTPFVGREREMNQLDSLVDQANSAHGQIVGLIGEAGAGKSRLLFEFREKLKDRSTVYLRGRCLSYSNAVPYAPLIDMIRRASQIQEGDPASIVVTKMRQSLQTVGISVDESLPFFLRLLDIQQGMDATDHLEPLALQNQTFKAMRRMILNASQRALVVMELEDLHWLDETSQTFLVSLVESITAARVLLIFTWRTGYQPPWAEKSYSSLIPLRRLSEGDSEHLLTSILKRQELSEEAREVLRKAEGNPLFLEELARALREHSGSGEAIPTTIQGILMARVDRLPREHKRLLQIASILGREFLRPLLETLWQFDTANQPSGTRLPSLLEDLQRWEWIYTSPSDEQHVTYLFKHALIQDVAYQSLLGQQREILHRQTATALEERYADRLEEAFDRLIYHYPRANEPRKTVHYLRLFAERAARNNTHAEAAQALRQALEHSANLDDPQITIEILLELAASLLPLAAFPETLERLVEHDETLARCEDPSLKGRYHFWLAHTSTYLGDQDTTREQAQLAIEAAHEAGDEATEGKACYVLGRDGFWSGRFQTGIENSLRAVVLLERAGEPWWQGQAYWVAGFNHYVLGEFDEALDALQRAFDIGEALDDHRLDTSWSMGYVHASLGDAEQGIAFCERGLAQSKDPLNSAVATGFLGYALAQADRGEEAIETLKQAIDALEPTGMLQILGWFAAFLAQAHLDATNIEEAEKVARQGLEWCVKGRFLYGEALGLSCLKRLNPEDDEISSRLDQLLDQLGLATELAQRL